MNLGTATASPEFVRWQPSELMEWAKRGYTTGSYNLARSGVPLIESLDELPGGPFQPDVAGHNEWGHEGLKATIAGLYGAKPENVLIAQGASQCNFLISGAVLSGGGAMIVEMPVYEPIFRGAQVWAERVDRLPRRKENGYCPDPDDLRRLLRSDTRLVMLTNLHNPTQVFMKPTLVGELTESASKTGATVMVDEAFLPMLDRDYRHHAFSKGAISISTMGKSWGLDGLRVGWAVGPADIIHRAYRLNNLMGVNQPYMTEDIVWRILNSPPAVKFMIERANRAALNRDLFQSFLMETPEVKAISSAAGISSVVELPAGTGDRKFTDELEKRLQTIAFPGSLFECPGCIRISYGGPCDEMAEGLRRVTRLIREGGY